MTTALLARIVDDLDHLYRGYHKGALIGEDAESEMVKKILGGGRKSAANFRREFLLVDALVRNRIGRFFSGAEGPRHVVVFGGNNVGKSTIINILAGRSVASVSPEGGHTRHAEAFAPGGTQALFPGNPFAFRRLDRNRKGELADAPLDQYGVSPLISEVLPPDIVLWDTPDCDAVGSESYLLAVIEAATAADVLVYVTSGEKYSVLDLVEWFLLLHSTGIDILECLNRTPMRDQAKIMESQRKRVLPLAARELDVEVPEPRVVGLKYMVEGEEEDLWDPDMHPEAAKLRAEVLGLLEGRDPRAAATRALDFVEARIGRLLHPAQMEIEATNAWAAEINTAIKEFPQIYEQNYLTSDKKLEPIARLDAEILNLLNPNIPGLNQALHALSWLARWPSKLTIKVAGHVWQAATTGLNKNAKEEPKELLAYEKAHIHVLEKLDGVIKTARKAKAYHPFWDELGEAWKEEFRSLNERFTRLIEGHMKETDRAITEAAGAIIESLRSRPALLKTLQSARVVTTVGGIAVSFTFPHAGTFAYDLLEESILAPVMAIGVDTAAQGAIAGYIKKCQVDLIAKLKQDAVNNAMALYGEPLNRVTRAARERAGTLGIDEQVLRRLPQDLSSLKAEIDRPVARSA